MNNGTRLATSTKTATLVTVGIAVIGVFAFAWGAVRFDRKAPTVSFSAPASGATISGPSVSLTATASDNVAVSSVKFLIGSTTISTDTTSPYAATLDSTAYTNGTYTLSAVATDSSGNKATNARSITISNDIAHAIPDTTPPSVSFSVPAGEAKVSGSTSLGANASDNIAVASVIFKIDGTTISTDTAAPYEGTLDTTKYTNGTHTITATATDPSGNTASASRLVTISNVVADTTPPTVAWTAPASGASLSGSAVALTATASDNVSVANVKFLIGSTLISTGSASPYSATLNTTGYVNGPYVLSAVATDSSGHAATTTRPVTIANVVPDTTPPTVVLTLPADRSVISGSSVSLTATASDNVAVASVKFLIDASSIATDTTAPYSATLDTTALANGNHSLSATATDSSGNTSVSTANVTVSNTVTAAPTATGWTVLTPSSDTRTVYVSAAGNDSWDGSAPSYTSGTSGPKLTLAAGRALLRNGYPDWLMLRRGDTFSGNLLGWTVGGRSTTEPAVISAYGSSTARPVVAGGFEFSSNSYVQHLSVVSVAFDEGAPNGDTAFGGVSGGDILIEDCYTHNFNSSIAFDGHPTAQGFSNVRIRRSVFNGSQDNMLFFNSVNGLLIEENVLVNASKTTNHAMYIARLGNVNVVTRGNVILYAGTKNAIMQRPGGLSEGNVVVNAGWNAIYMGQCNDLGGPTYGACLPSVPVTIRGNLVTEGQGGAGGIFNDPAFTLPGAVIEDNLILHMTVAPLYVFSFRPGGDGATVQRNVVYDATSAINTGSNQLWQNNTFYSTQALPLMYGDSLSQVSGFRAVSNRFYSTGQPANSWFMMGNLQPFSTWKTSTGETGTGTAYALTAPTRSIETYSQSLGLAASRDAFFAEAAKQSKLNWRTEYTAPAIIAYMKAGF